MASTRSRLDVIAEITAPGQPYELTVMDDIRGPVRMFANAPRTLRDIYTEAVSDAEFLVAGDERWTFAEFWRDASTIGHLLVHELGVRPGDRVAISMRNHPEWMLAFTAATSVGAIAVAMNSLWNAEEMTYGLQDSGAVVLFADRERLELLEQCPEIPGLRVVAVRHTGAARADVDLAVRVAAIGHVPMPDVDLAPEDPALILYTSGSTGHPKGVLSNHRNVVVALMAWEVEYGALALRTGESVSPPEGSPNGPATLLGIPLFHVLGLHGVFLASFRSQRKTVTMLKWDAAVAAELIERERIITFTGPPAITGDLVREARRAGQRPVVAADRRWWWRSPRSRAGPSDRRHLRHRHPEHGVGHDRDERHRHAHRRRRVHDQAPQFRSVTVRDRHPGRRRRRCAGAVGSAGRVAGARPVDVPRVLEQAGGDCGVVRRRRVVPHR